VEGRRRNALVGGGRKRAYMRISATAGQQAKGGGGGADEGPRGGYSQKVLNRRSWSEWANKRSQYINHGVGSKFVGGGVKRSERERDVKDWNTILCSEQ
jgi:hypothetical protein